MKYFTNVQNVALWTINTQYPFCSNYKIPAKITLLKMVFPQKSHIYIHHNADVFIHCCTGVIMWQTTFFRVKGDSISILKQSGMSSVFYFNLSKLKDYILLTEGVFHILFWLVTIRRSTHIQSFNVRNTGID